MWKSSDKKIIIWLLSGCFLIFTMVVVGGITRLTGSGLSITEWNVIMGAIPPLNEHQWQEAFDKYKAIPQFQLINYDFTLGQFKSIFWWEFIHRLIGRLLGVVFLLPFAWFYITRQLDKTLMRKSLFLFALGGLQGFLGWYMVSSGLTERTSVSHYRLAIHLFTAFMTYGFALWFALELIYKRMEDGKWKMENGKWKTEELSRTASRFPFAKRTNPSSGGLPSSRLLAKLLFAIIIIQIIYGAFVAGLHAGKFANTWPTMDGAWIPAGLFSMKPALTNFFENMMTVQFIHRCIAILIVILTLLIVMRSGRSALNRTQKKALFIIVIAVCMQFLLGIFTLITKVQITLAVFHQIGAFLLFSACIFLLFHYRTPTNYEFHELRMPESEKNPTALSSSN